MSKRKGRIRYAPEFRRQMVELVRAGRTPEELAREFEPTANSDPLKWVEQLTPGRPGHYRGHNPLRRGMG